MRFCRIICSPSWALLRNRNSAKEILSPTRQNTLNTPFKDQGRVWWVRPQKLSQEVKRGGRKKMGECCFKRLTHNYDMAIYQSNWQQPKMGSYVMFMSQIYSNIPKLDKFGVFIGIPLRLRLKRGAEGPNSCGGMGVATHFRWCPEITALTTVELNFRCEWHREDTGEAVLSCVWHWRH